MNLDTLHSRSAHRPAHRALSLVQTIVIVGVAALLVTLIAGSVRAGFQLHRDRTIRENLQTVWIIANQYFITTGTNEVSLETLKKPLPNVDSLTSLKPVADEDYSQINKGKITRNDDELVLEYRDGKKTLTATYPTH
jgi:hypothetical protein